VSSPASLADRPREALRPELDAVERRLNDAGDLDLPPMSGLLQLMFGSGGKRIRPALAIASARLGACDPLAVASLGAAVESLHAATLVHDDLVDGSTLRRGMPTVNANWGSGATVLAGDWLFARAARFAAATGSLRVIDIFARTLQTLTDGELRQLFGRRTAPTRAEYEKRIYAKTAALFEASCEMGGVLARQGEPVIEALAGFGRQLGMAFQIVDDILDFTGTADRLGKPVGSDLANGTITLPALLHMERTGGRWPQNGGADETQALARAVAADVEALQASQAVARAHLAAAGEILGRVPAGEARELLGGLARLAVERDT
jgi:octaprenyl-diphosphate synthase